MKAKRIVAALLAVSMIGSIAGCSKVKSADIDTFVDACEEMDVEQIEPDEFEDVDPDEYTEGFYVLMDEDDLEDVDPMVWAMLRIYGLNFGIDEDDIEELAIVLKTNDMTESATSFESAEDIEDLDIDAFFATQITLSEPVDIEDMTDELDDMLDNFHLDIDELSSDEFRSSKNALRFTIRVDLSELAQAFLDSDVYEDLEDTMDSEFVEQLEKITGEIVFGLYAENENVVMIFGVSVNNDHSENTTEFTDALGFPSLEDLPSNEAVVEAVIDRIESYASLVGSYVSRAAAAAEEYEYYGF